MKRIITALLTGLLAVLIVIGLVIQPGLSAVQNTYVVPSLKPAWATGNLSDGSGGQGIVVGDLDQDGKVEIASCSKGYVFILHETSPDIYDTIWYSQYLGCLRLTSGDRDQDGVSELYLTTETGKVVVIDGKTHATLGSFSTEGLNCKGIATGDVDGDGSLEIVVTDTPATLVYNATSFEREWRADYKGGSNVSVGNIDGDPLPEIVVNGETTGYVLNASTQTQEWAYAGGFGYRLALGDVDDDSMDEIIFHTDSDYYRIYVLNGDDQSIEWSRNDLGDLGGMGTADVDGNGSLEVLVGMNGWGLVYVLDGKDGEEIASISNPAYSVIYPTAGDVNNDGSIEIIWGGGFALHGHGLFVGDWTSETVLWGTTDLDAPLYVAAGDVDDDGEGEFVMASRTTRQDYGGGTLRIYDGATRQVEWSIDEFQEGFDIYHLALGQLDADPALEILMIGVRYSALYLYSFDGASHEIEWEGISSDFGAVNSLSIKNVDADPVEEIILGLSKARLVVMDGASNVIEFDTGDYALDKPVIDLSVGDLDEDGDQDVAILTAQGVFVYDTDGWKETLFEGMYNGVQVAISEADLNGGAELLLVTKNSDTDFTLQAWDGENFATVWLQPLGYVTVKDLVPLDIDQDGVREYLLIGGEGELPTRKSLLWVGSKSYPSFWETRLKGFYDIINSSAFYDVDNDQQAELLFGAFDLIQVNELTTKSVNLSLAYLPFTNKPCIPVPAYFDDFSDPYSGWPVIDTDSLLLEYKLGEYRMLLREKYGSISVRPAFTATEYAVEVDLRNINNIEGSYGLAFAIAADWSSLYTLEIYPDGWYGVYRFDSSGVLTLVEAYSPAINLKTAANHIKAERQGDQIRVYANGEYLTTVYDNVLSGSRSVGLVVFTYDEKNLDIRFDNFTVWPIECGGEVNSIQVIGDWQPVPPQPLDFGLHGHGLDK